MKVLRLSNSRKPYYIRYAVKPENFIERLALLRRGYKLCPYGPLFGILRNCGWYYTERFVLKEEDASNS